MWTRKDIDEFKANLLQDGGEAVIKVNHGETVTVSTFYGYSYFKSYLILCALPITL